MSMSSWFSSTLTRAQRRPRLHHDIVAVAVLARDLLVAAGMQLDLVHHRKDIGGVHKRFKMMGLEIAHADGAHPPVQVERLERAPRFLVRALPFGFGALRSRPVDEIQVDVVEMELARDSSNAFSVAS